MRHFYAILVGLCLTLFAQDVCASHAMGADLQYTCLGNNQYRVRLSFYRDCAGIDVGTAAVTITAPSCGINTSQSFTLTEQTNFPCPGGGVSGTTGCDVSPLCPSQISQNACNAANPNTAPYPGVRSVVYEGIITLPSACSEWFVRFTENARNPSDNTTGGNTANLSVQAVINNTIDPLTGQSYCNNSVSFSSLPVPFYCVNNPVTYNQGAVDADGDSLRYTIITPLGNSFNPLSYQPGYSASQPIRTNPPNSFQFDPATGQMSFTPSFVETDVLAVRVDEYRNGVLVGSTIRDIQVKIINCTVSTPVQQPIDSIQNANQQDSITLQVCPGTQVSFDIKVIDPLGRNLTLKSSIQNNPSPLPGATLTQINQGSAPNDTAVARIQWTPAAADTGCRQFVLTAENDDCPIKGNQTRVYKVCVFNKVQLLTASPTFCGKPVQLTATGGTNFTWNPTTGLSSSSVLNPVASPAVPTTYKFTSDCGTDSVFVNVAQPFVYDAGAGGQICQNGQIQLNASVDNLYSPYSIKWIPSNGLVDPVYAQANDTILNPVASPLATTKYKVQFTANNGCINEDSVTVVVSGTGPMIKARTNKTLVCPGEPAQLTLISNPLSCGISLQPCSGNDVTAQVGTFTSSSNNSPVQLPSPLGGYHKSTRHQFLYRASEILALSNSGGKIKSIAINLLAAGTQLNNLTIKMACVSADSIKGYIAGGNLATVYTPKNYTPVAGWNVFTLDNTYDWDGQSNLLVDICHNSTTANGQHMRYQITRTDGSQGFANYSSVWCTASSAFDQCGITGTDQGLIAARYKERPNMRFVICVADLSTANIAWTPNSGANAPTPLNRDTTIARPQTPQIYSVAVSDQNSCTGNSFVFVNVDTSVRLTMPNDTFICATNTTVKLKARVTTSLPNPNLTYTWAAVPSAGFVSPGNRDSVTVSPSATTKYYITVTGAACQLVDSVTVAVGSGIPVDMVGTNLTCFGVNDGAITVNVPGNPPGLSYAWVPNTLSGSSVDSLSPGVYSVTVTNQQGCQGSDTIVISQPANLQLNISRLNVLCFGQSNGNFTATVIGGTPVYNYSWNPNLGNTATPNSLPVGVYRITVTDSKGCTVEGIDSISQPPALNVVVATTNATTNGGNEGTAKANITGGSPSFTYTWSNAANTDSISSLVAGNYCVTVRDSRGCTAAACGAVTDPPPIILTFTKVDVLCNAQTTGSASVSAVGGILPYRFRWSSNPLSDTINAISNVAAGTYTVTVTDSAGVSVTGNVTINQPTAIAIAFDSVPIDCNGGNNASILAVPAGGTPGYTYAWQAPLNQQQAAVQGLGAGTYTVIVTDANSCTASASLTLAEPEVLTITTNVVNDVSCYGGSNGAANAVAAGGTLPYSFAWSNSVSQDSVSQVSDLTAGNQTAIVTDARGCVATSNFSITQPPVFSVSVVTTNANCPTSNDGSGTGNIVGGIGPYTFQWDNVTGPQTQNALVFGNHAVVVTDANQCTASANFYIDTNYTLRVNVQTTDATCFGLNNGSVVVSPINGTPVFAYQYFNNTNQTVAATNLLAGSYSVIATDNLNCIASEIFVINEPSQMVLSLSKTDPRCAGDANGQASVLASGGTPGYLYLWSNTQTNQTAQNMVAGSYSVTVTDNNQCTVSESITLIDPLPLQVAFSNRKEISCAGADDAAVSVEANGGTSPYTYLWQQNQYVTTASSQTIENLGPGNYVVVVTDNNNCAVQDTATFVSPPILGFSYVITDSTSCPGSADGRIRALAVGGSPSNLGTPYTYSLDNVTYQPSGVFSNLIAAAYRVYVKDGNNCVYDTLVAVAEPLPLSLQILPQDSTIELGNQVQLAILPSGYSGSALNGYSWSPSTGLSCVDCANPLATPYRDIEYTLTVRYLGKCSLEKKVNVFVLDGKAFFIPNVFSPNSDGVNDVWQIYGYDMKEVDVKVFNRWGEKVFDSQSNQYTAWDGSYKGVLQEPGIYTFTVQAEYLNGKVARKSGTITLVR
jgi:gliding motility-associated-like protein